jgi:DNA-binding NarL/FixJ family response regulator
MGSTAAGFRLPPYSEPHRSGTIIGIGAGEKGMARYAGGIGRQVDPEQATRLSQGGKAPMRQVRVLIADPADLARQGLRGLLSAQGDLEVAAICRTVEEAVSQAITQSPDVVLLGYGFSEPQRLEAIRQIVTQRPWTPVLVLTDRLELDAFLSVVRAGAQGYLGGNVDGAGLINAIRTLGAGGCVMDPHIVMDLFAYVANRPLATAGREARGPRNGSPLAKLTPRERDVIRLMAQGRGNKEIGALLGISVGTVKTHLRHIFRKLGVSDRTGAVLTALEIDPTRFLPAA